MGTWPPQTRIEHIFEKSVDAKIKLPFYTHYGDVTDINNLVPYRATPLEQRWQVIDFISGDDFEQGPA